MIEQGFIYVDLTFKEMTDFFEIQIENLEPLVAPIQASLARYTVNKPSQKKSNPNNKRR